jgi:farnesyl-diphosphate farnesyltransferase
LLLQSSNLRGVCDIFIKYTREIHRKATPKDPNFIAVSTACGKIEQFIESVFPGSTNETVKARREALKAPEREAAQAAQEAHENRFAPDKSEVYQIYAAVIGLWVVVGGFMFFVAWLMGAKFDFLFRYYEKVMEAARSTSTPAVKGEL